MIEEDIQVASLHTTYTKNKRLKMMPAIQIAGHGSEDPKKAILKWEHNQHSFLKSFVILLATAQISTISGFFCLILAF